MGDIYDICHEKNYKGPHKFGDSSEEELESDELSKSLREILTRLQAIEDKIDSLDERMADLDRIELLRQYDD